MLRRGRKLFGTPSPPAKLPATLNCGGRWLGSLIPPTFAHGALFTVTRGGTVVSRVTKTMDGITESSRKVAEIIGMIEGIASQTTILALNAGTNHLAST